MIQCPNCKSKWADFWKNKKCPQCDKLIKMTEQINKVKFTPASNGGCAGPLGCQDRLRFTPAASVIENRAKDKYKEYSLNWWSPNSLFKYDAMLCSAFYGMEDKVASLRGGYREHYQIPEDFLLIADSGGFEQCTQNIRIDPIEVLKWQEENANVAFTLDIPPVNPTSLALTEDLEYFKKCAEASQRNADKALSNRQKIELYYVLQGHKKEELDIWMGDINPDEYDGLALSFKSVNEPVWLAVQACYAKEMGIEKVHVLTGTGWNVVPIIHLLKRYFKQVTFDSSSYGVGARLMKYNLPYRYHILFGRSYNEKIVELPCDCPVCEKITVDDFQTGDSTAGALISLHNLCVYFRHLKFLNGIVQDDDLFFGYISKHCTDETVRAWRFFKDFDDMGFDKAYNFNFKKQKSNFGDW